LFVSNIFARAEFYTDLPRLIMSKRRNSVSFVIDADKPVKERDPNRQRYENVDSGLDFEDPFEDEYLEESYEENEDDIEEEGEENENNENNENETGDDDDDEIQVEEEVYSIFLSINNNNLLNYY
jgi:hypothetical protein